MNKALINISGSGRSLGNKTVGKSSARPRAKKGVGFLGLRPVAWIMILSMLALSSMLYWSHLKVGAQGGSLNQVEEEGKGFPISEIKEDLCIRFHVLANSDTDEDQALKNMVRDAILEEVSPQLAASQSLDESRRILTSLLPLMEERAGQVLADQGKKHDVRVEYGEFSFPTKSYDFLVFPAGKYEAVRILIGKAEGSNWWCVLFPPLCFIDIDHGTALPVNGESQSTVSTAVSKRVKPRSWFLEQIEKLRIF